MFFFLVELQAEIMINFWIYKLTRIKQDAISKNARPKEFRQTAELKLRRKRI